MDHADSGDCKAGSHTQLVCTNPGPRWHAPLVGAGAWLVGLVWFVGPLCWYDVALGILCNCVASFVCFCSIPGMGACNSRITKTRGNG